MGLYFHKRIAYQGIFEVVMAQFKALLPATLLVAGLSLVATGCGNGNPRVLQSISVSPASADAQNFPNAQVQFTAVGTYSQPPSPSPTTASSWSLADPAMATINQSGVAQCNSGASGVTTIAATAPAPCHGTGCTAVQLVGTAQLTCP